MNIKVALLVENSSLIFEKSELNYLSSINCDLFISITKFKEYYPIDIKKCNVVMQAFLSAF